MKITFHGAALTTTGSMHLAEINGTRILLDCGLYQGRRKEAFERNRTLPFDPSTVDRIILSHAHMDHSGNLPSMVKKGFKGEIYSTPATRDLCDIMLRDSAHIQEKDVEYVNKKRIRMGKKPFEPLYNAGDVDDVMECFKTMDYGEPFHIAPGATATFYDAGHLLGSSLTVIEFTENNLRRRLLFTGDLGRPNMPILNNPEIVHDIDILVTESTYGDRIHPPMADVAGRFKGFIDDIQAHKSKLIIPSFSVGRTQEIVFLLHKIHHEGRIGVLPIFVDSPLSSRATGVYEKHRECYDWEAIKLFMEGHDPFQFGSLQYITRLEDSKKLNDMPGPAIIISASGMCEAGRILHHLACNIGNPRNILLFVGFQAENTLGRKIVEHQNPVRILGEDHEVNARVHTINALSAHADRREFMEYFTHMGPETVKKAFVVHGEVTQTASLVNGLESLGISDVVAPAMGQSFEI